MDRPDLPVDAVLPELVDALRARDAAVLVAPTGAGKTTRVPPALLELVAPGRRVLVAEPRRLAARAAARRVAHERGVPVGGEVGHVVRFDDRTGRDTRLVYLTLGVLLRRLQDDPFLEDVGAVVFDEFHERSLDTDLAFAMVRRVREARDEPLPLVVMSATLDVEAVAAALDDAPVVRSEGRAHPVDVRWMPPEAADRPWTERVVLGVRNLLDATSGDLLVFLPGVGEIRRATDELAELARDRGVGLAPLYGDLPAEQQDAVLSPGDRRRVVLATNVAETSVTIPGVTGVVDTGTARVLRHDPAAGLDRLVLEPISRASADQRAGRAGRTAPGVCARLWSEAEHGNRPAHTVPELHRVDLAGPVLQLLVWGEADPAALPWLEAPGAPALARALAELEALGAVRDGTPTARGRDLARLPVHPRVGALLLEGAARGVLRRAALAAALLSERDPYGGPRGDAEAVSDSDVLDRVRRLEEAGRGGPAGVRHVRRVADQLERLARRRGEGGDARRGARGDGGRRARPADAPADEDFLRMLVAALPDRVARRRERGSDRGVLVGGRGVRLDARSTVRDAELFLCVDLSGGPGGEARVRLASRVERAWLPRQDLVRAVEAGFDEETGRVVARRRLRYRDLVLEETPAKLADPAAAGSALAEAAAARPADALPLDAPEVVTLRARVAFLAEHAPELGLPALDDAAVAALLPALCAGRRSFDELRRAPLADALLGLLDHRQRKALDEHAPERLAVPSGSRLALRYEPGRPPVLAVRIQEVFGWEETPRLARGRVPVLLELLAPNHRPEQVTDDLASFWANTYPRVRKDLRARYPKHAWPEDPTQAVAERRPRRRR